MISPPWALHNILVCRDMYQFKKQEYQQEEMKTLIYEHLARHNNSFKMYTDRSKTEHGIGYALIGDDIAVSRRIQNFASIFTAELATLQDFIDMCHDTHYPTITLITDSHSAIQALTQYNCKSIGAKYPT